MAASARHRADLLAPIATVATLSAAATFTVALPAGAATHAAHKAAPGKSSETAAKPMQAQAPNRHQGVGSAVTPDYGYGKVNFDKLPNTYPPTENNTVFPGLDAGVALDLRTGNEGRSTSCKFASDLGGSEDWTTCAAIQDFAYEGDSFAVNTTGADVGANWLLPPYLSGVFDQNTAACTDPQITHTGTFLGTCTLGTVLIAGKWRHLVITLTNASTGAPIAGVTYDLSAVEQPSARGSAAHRSGTASPVLESATSDSQGRLFYNGWYLGAPYQLTQASSPKGYVPQDGPQTINVAAITKYSQAGTPWYGAAQLTPYRPSLNDDFSKGPYGKSQLIHVLANDTAAAPPLHVTTVTQPAHGTVHVNKNKTVTFVPADGFHGTTTFTYGAANNVGGAGTARVTVVVGPPEQPATPPVEHRPPPQLPETGARVTAEEQIGGGALILGALLTIAGRRRRRQTAP